MSGRKTASFLQENGRKTHRSPDIKKQLNRLTCRSIGFFFSYVRFENKGKLEDLGLEIDTLALKST